MNDIPVLKSGDVILLRSGAIARLLSTDYHTMICKCEDGVTRAVRCSEYAGLLKQADYYDLEDTQEFIAVDRLVNFLNAVE